MMSIIIEQLAIAIGLSGIGIVFVWLVHGSPDDFARESGLMTMTTITPITPVDSADVEAVSMRKGATL